VQSRLVGEKFYGNCNYCGKYDNKESKCFKKPLDLKKKVEVSAILAGVGKQLVANVMVGPQVVRALVDIGANASFVKRGIIQEEMILDRGKE
jgi:hypothetical protein